MLTGDAGIGVVIRDHLGVVKLRAWKVIFDASDAEETEALACKEGISLAAEWFQNPVIVESDCAAVVQYFEEMKTMKPPCYSIIQEASCASSRLPRLECKER
jgi:hypothetical protein